MIAGLAFGFHSTGLRNSIEKNMTEMGMYPRPALFGELAIEQIVDLKNLDRLSTDGDLLQLSSYVTDSSYQRGGLPNGDSAAFPANIKAAIYQSAAITEAASLSLRRQLGARNSPKDQQGIQNKLQQIQKVLQVFRELPFRYHPQKIGLCGRQPIPGFEGSYPAAIQYGNLIHICPVTAYELQLPGYLHTTIIHEAIHQSHQRFGRPTKTFANDFAYECDTDSLALEIHFLGTGFRGYAGYDCR